MTHRRRPQRPRERTEAGSTRPDRSPASRQPSPGARWHRSSDPPPGTRIRCTTRAHFHGNSREIAGRSGKTPDRTKGPDRTISPGQSPADRRAGLYAGFCHPVAFRQPNSGATLKSLRTDPLLRPPLELAPGPGMGRPADINSTSGPTIRVRTTTCENPLDVGKGLNCGAIAGCPIRGGPSITLITPSRSLHRMSPSIRTSQAKSSTADVTAHRQDRNHPTPPERQAAPWGGATGAQWARTRLATRHQWEGFPQARRARPAGEAQPPARTPQQRPSSIPPAPRLRPGKWCTGST